MLSFVVLSAVLIASATAQITIGTCSITQIDNYIRTLTNGETCLNASNAIFAGINNDAYNTYCTRECGGAVSTYLLLNCGEAAVPSVITAYLSCLPATGSSLGRRCVSTLPGVLSADILTTLAPCGDYNPATPTTCPTNCATGLTRAVVDQLGCCFQAVYNDTILLASYQAVGALNASQVALINQIRNRMLWSACSVNLVAQCAISPYPRDPRYIVGTCSATDFGTFFAARSTSQTCIEDLTNLNQSLAFFRTPAGMQTLDRACTEECGRPLRMFYNNTCHDETAALNIENFCLRSDGSRGNRCRFALDRSLATDPVLLSLGNCFTFDPSNPNSPCPATCRNALSSLSSEFGCCYQSIYNSTGYLDALIIDESITFEDRGFWYGIRNPALWSRCSVPLVPACTGDPFSAGAVKFVASFSVLLFVLVASLNL